MFAEGAGGFAMAMAVLSLKFIGFELTPTLIEETNFPRKKMWVVILTALIIPALLYGFVVLALGGVATRAERRSPLSICTACRRSLFSWR